jgi:hypothetical protein
MRVYVASKAKHAAENMKQEEAEFIRFLRAGSQHAFQKVAASDRLGSRRRRLPPGR